MFKDGVVWGLASMSKSNDVTIARLCSVALCNLSCQYWKDIALSNSMQVCRSSFTELVGMFLPVHNKIVKGARG